MAFIESIVSYKLQLQCRTFGSLTFLSGFCLYLSK